MQTNRELRNGSPTRLADLAPPRESRLLPRPRRGSATPYDAKADRPLLQLGLRAGLWVALGVGCIGGALAILRPGDDQPDVVDDPTAEPWIVPGPVAGVAESTVERWLAASDQQRDALADMFVEPPLSSDDAAVETEGTGGGLEVSRVTAVAGELLQDGYWSVTVAAEVFVKGPSPGGADGGAATADALSPDDEPDEPDEGDQPDQAVQAVQAVQPDQSDEGDQPDQADQSDEGDQPDQAVQSDQADQGDQGGTAADGPATWFIEVGIVADGHGGFVALAAPAVVPAPAGLDPAWAVSGERESVEPDDQLAVMVEKFLGALLAGSGDAAPYLAPGAEIQAADPAPFVDIAVGEIATEDLGDDRTWVLVHVMAATSDGARLPLTYDLTVVERVDRWEVEALSGVPTYIK